MTGPTINSPRDKVIAVRLTTDEQRRFSAACGEVSTSQRLRELVYKDILTYELSQQTGVAKYIVESESGIEIGIYDEEMLQPDEETAPDGSTVLPKDECDIRERLL